MCSLCESVKAFLLAIYINTIEIRIPIETLQLRESIHTEIIETVDKNSTKADLLLITEITSLFQQQKLMCCGFNVFCDCCVVPAV